VTIQGRTLVTSPSLEKRIQVLEDREAIRELITRYGLVVDDRDMDGIAACFAQDGAFRSRDGVMNARGREAVLAQFRGRFAVLGPSNHYTHDHLLRFDEQDPDRAYGIVTSHAEVVRNGEPMWAALRYEDVYLREDGRWRFLDRLLSFFYYVKVADYASCLPQILRMRAYEEPAPADYPEALPSWRRYYCGI
jgi:ketosteroid isomerase-like protein